MWIDITVIIIIYRPLPDEAPGSLMLSDLSPTSKERAVYETIEGDHEYEILDKYNLQPQYDDVKIPPVKPERLVQPQPLSAPAGDYDFTQCPAYIAVSTTTTSIHGNTNELVNTPGSVPPTADQKDK